MRNPPGVPELAIRLRPEALQVARINTIPVLEAIRAAYGTVPVGQVYEGKQVFDVTIGLSEEARGRAEEVGALLVKAPSGRYAPLSQLAEIQPAIGRYAVLHDGGRRAQVVTSAYSGEDLGSFAAAVEARVRAVPLPRGIEVTFGGAAVSQSAAAGTLLTHSAMAAVAMTLLLALTIPRLRNLLLVFANLPFALIGGVLALYLTVGTASLGALVGFVTLFGITLRNGIMLLAHYDHLMMIERRPWALATVVEGAADRATPILMTTLATALGLLPLALGTGEAGREIEGPMAIVILGGLASSAILTLLVLPLLAWRLGRFRDPCPRESAP
jgi:Cu/Ag efflux pump CusA